MEVEEQEVEEGRKKNFLVAEQETRVSSEGITGLFIYALMPW